ncbi:MAG: RHS repeat-associated core domain-containing protein, partial [Vicinamibacterales bacterium]
PLGHTTVMAYDAGDRLLSTIDPLGRTASRTYDAAGNVTSSINFDGNTSSFTYNSRNQLLTSTDPDGRVTALEYDSRGNLRRSTQPLGGVSALTYDSAGNGLTLTDALGRLTSYAYDTSGSLSSLDNARGVRTSFTYDARGNRLATTTYRTVAGSGNEAVTALQSFDPVSRPSAIRDPSGSTTTLDYDASGLVGSITDSNGHVTRYEYDAVANPTAAAFPDLSRETSAYDAAGRSISRTNRDGHTTQFEYDALGRRTRATHSDGSASTRTYDAVGRVLTETDERGNTTTHTYGVNRHAVTDAIGNVTLQEFNGRGRPIRRTDANGKLTMWSYDAAGRLSSLTFSDGTQQTTTYDAAGNKLTETDPAGHTTSFGYDALNRLVTVVDTLGQITSFAYDEVGNRIGETDALGRVTRLEYDAAGRLTQRTRPLGQSERFAYDANGNLLAHTDFNGNVVSYEYDTNNRRQSKRATGGSEITYAYTPAGLRTKAGAESWVHDSRGRVIGHTSADGDAVAFTYDAAGMRTSITTAYGTTAYTFDQLNRLATVTDALGTTQYTYDAVGNLASMTYPNGLSTRYRYDLRHRVVEVVTEGPGGPFASYAYTLDAAGKRIRAVEVESGRQRTVDYTYDAVDRLVREVIDETGSAGDLDIAYFYDAVGNRERKQSVSSAETIETLYTYDNNDRLLTEATTTTSAQGSVTSASVLFAYDANGSVVSRTNGSQTDIYAYDSEGRLVAASVQSGNVPGHVTYTYSTDGMRIGRTVGVVTTRFVLADFWGLTQVLAAVSGGDVTTYSHGHDLISQVRSDTGPRYYQYDGLLSTRHLTDKTGTATDAYTYDAFGITLTATGSTPNDFLYRGEQLDPNLGFYYLRARHYMQATGRFLTTDPFEGVTFDPPSLHRYLYANADPVNRWDPSGEFSLIEIGQTISFYTQWVVLTAARPALNAIASTGSRLLGNALLQNFTLRFAARIGVQTAERILIRTGVAPSVARREVLKATSSVLDPLERVTADAVLKSGKIVQGRILAVLFSLFAGDQARAQEQIQELAPQDPEELAEVAAFVVFLEEDRDIVPPRFKLIVETLLGLMFPLLPIPVP